MGPANRLRWAWAVLLVGALSATAEAQSAGTDQTPEARDQEARTLYEAGRVAFEEERFEDALGYFEQSYDLSGRPELLYNMGSVADRLRRNAVALEHFEAFLEAMPDAENRPMVEERIRILRDALEHGTVPSPAETARAGMETQIIQVYVTEERKPRTGLWVGLGVTAAVLVGVAVALAVVLRDPSPDYQPSDEGLLVFTLEETP